MPDLNHLGVNAVFLQRGLGGLETYVRRLLPELLDLRPELRVTVYVNEAGRAMLERELWSDRVTLHSGRLLGLRGLRALTEVSLLGRLAKRDGVDLLHSVAMLGPLRFRPHVVTVGDLIWMHDRRTVDWLTTTIWSTLVPRVARRADRVLTFSEASKSDLVELLGLMDERIDVVPLGPGAELTADPEPEDELRRRYDLGAAPVILSVSAKKSHKNLIRLVEALALVRRRVPAVLVVPGEPTAHEVDLKEKAASLGVADALRLPPYVDAAELEGLYGLASCVAFPSLHEGFGLPVLEAMRRGVPVASSNRSSLPEVGGDAVRYFDPEDLRAMADAILELLENPSAAEELGETGRRHAAGFSWRATAEATLESYARALTVGGR